MTGENERRRSGPMLAVGVVLVLLATYVGGYFVLGERTDWDILGVRFAERTFP